MAKDLKHYVRIHTLHEEGMKSFVLIGLDSEEQDSCVTLVRCKSDKDSLKKEFDRWGCFNWNDIDTIEALECGEQFIPDNESIIIRLS